MGGGPGGVQAGTGRFLGSPCVLEPGLPSCPCVLPTVGRGQVHVYVVKGKVSASLGRAEKSAWHVANK